MAFRSWVPGGAVACVLAGVAGMSSMACSDAKEEVGGAGALDAGRPEDAALDASLDAGANSGADAASVDAGTAGGDILLDIVHASPDTPRVGLCLAAVVGGSAQFVAPFDTVQGPLPRYAGAQLRIPAALQTAISNVAVRVYLVPGYAAPEDAGATSCASVIATPGAAVLLKEFPAGYFQAGRGYLIAATGCSAANATVAKCGADPVVSTNARPLQAYVATVDRSPLEASAFGMQFVHLSPQAEALGPLANGVRFAQGDPAGTDDAGAATYRWTSWASGSGAIKAFRAPTALVVAPSVGDPNALALGIYLASNAGATPTGNPLLSVGFGLVAAATLGPTNPAVPSYFKKGVSYTYIALGDPLQSSNPQAPNAGPDFLRVLAFPNNTPPTPAPAAAPDASVADASAN